MKRSKLFRKKLLPLFLSVAVAGSQVPVMAADFGDTAVVSADADETERSQSIRNQGQTGESSEAGAEDGGTTQNDTDGVSVAGTSDTETEEISQGSDDNISEELDQDDRTDWTSPDSEENVFSDSTENTFGDGTGDGEDSQIEYIKGRPLTEEEEKEQLAPFDSLTSYTTAEPIGNDTEDVPGARAAAYPSYYNAADLGYVTSVKNQEPYGMCWAFGMASLMETSLLSQGLGTYDLSEEHLAYFWANRSNDPLGNTAGDINRHYGTDDYGNVDYHEGGNDLLASMFLSTWSGMTTEADVPLATDSTHTQKTGAIPARSKEFHSSAYLMDLCSRLVPLFTAAGVRIIRLGLHSSPEVKEKMVAGAFHDSFGELVYSRMLLRRVLAYPPGAYTVTVHPRYYSRFVGNKKQNLDELAARQYQIRLQTDTALAGEMRIEYGIKNT